MTLGTSKERCPSRKWLEGHPICKVNFVNSAFRASILCPNPLEWNIKRCKNRTDTERETHTCTHTETGASLEFFSTGFCYVSEQS